MADIRIKDLATTATSSASDDYLALDGSTNGTRKILATNVANNVTDVIFGASGPSAKSSIAARAARQGLVFDGTSNATFSVAGPGTSDFTHAIIVKTTQTSRAFTSGTPTAIVSLWVSSGGFAQVRNDGVAILLTGTKTINDGKSHYIVASRTGGTLFLYVDGVLDASVADSTNFSTATTYIGKDYSAGILLTGSVTPVGFYNRALSAAEVVSLYEAGVPAGSDYNTASNTAVNLATTVNSGYDTFSGASASGFTAVKTTTAAAASAYSGTDISIAVGQRLRIAFTCTLTSGTLPVIYLSNTGGTLASGPSAQITAGANVIELTCTIANATARARFFNSPADTVNYAISGLSVTRIGLLLAPDAAQSGGGLTWYDTSGNAANITLPATGVSWNVPTSGKAFSLSLASTTAGSAGAGALVVSGGLATGAASYFGGDLTIPSSIVYTNRVYNYTGGATPLILGWTGSAAVLSLFSSGAATFAGAVTIGGNATGGILRLGGTAPSADQAAEIFLTTSNTAFNWKVLTNTSGPGIFELRQSTAAGGTTFTDAILRITPNVTATSTTVSFLGAVAIGNTTAAAVAAPSTHKVSILIGGVQYYLLASNV